MNQQTPAETLKEQRAIIRTLRKEHPKGRRMMILKDGTRPTYEQATQKGSRCDLYKLPCDEFKCNISLLTPDMIDVQATKKLWSGKPSQYQQPPVHRQPSAHEDQPADDASRNGDSPARTRQHHHHQREEHRGQQHDPAAAHVAVPGHPAQPATGTNSTVGDAKGKATPPSR